MSIDAMKQALEALELLARYENPATKIQVRKPRDGGSIVTMYPHKVASEAAAAFRAAIEQAQEPCVKTIKTWQQRCEEHPDHNGIVSDGMIQARMQEEINELRDAIKSPTGAWWHEPSAKMNYRKWQGLTDEDASVS